MAGHQRVGQVGEGREYTGLADAHTSRNEAAVAAASSLFSTSNNNFDAADYVQKIHLSVEEDRANQESSGWMDLLRGPNLRRLLIAVGIQCLQQAQGVTYILNYITFFLGYAGITNPFPFIISAFCVNYAGVLTGYYFPDKFGRRVLVIWTSLVCAVSVMIMSSLMAAGGGGSSGGVVIVVMLFIWMGSLGAQSPLIWIITAESAPTRNRERVIATAIFFGFGTALLTASVSPFIADAGYGNLGGKIVSQACFLPTSKRKSKIEYNTNERRTIGFLVGQLLVLLGGLGLLRAPRNERLLSRTA